jgi:hypothetical protein
VNDTSGRQPSKFSVLKEYPERRTRSAPKYLLFFFLIIILGGSVFLTYRIFNMDDIISKSIGPAPDVLEKLIIEKLGKESAIKKKPYYRSLSLG